MVVVAVITVIVIIMVMMAMMIIVIVVVMPLRVGMSDLIPTLDKRLLSNYLGGERRKRQLLLDYNWLGNHRSMVIC